MTGNPKFIILLGPPASGKGTQAAIIRDTLELPHVASGDLFRYNLRNKTELGIKAKHYMDQGALVPDDITIAMVLDRLSQPDCAKGALLDGFPRTIAQAEALESALSEKGLGINRVVNITVPDEALIARITGRRLCRTCGEPYHLLFKLPKVPGVCDLDGGELYQRDDDTEATAQRRLQVYWEQTSPLVDYYRQRGLIVDVDGDRPIEVVTEALIAAVANL